MHLKFSALATAFSILFLVPLTSGAPTYEQANNDLSHRTEPFEHLSPATINFAEYDLARRGARIVKGDTVIVASGRYKGVKGTVTAVVHLVQLTVSLCNGAVITCSPVSCALASQGC
jgi:hypothetical protein